VAVLALSPVLPIPPRVVTAEAVTVVTTTARRRLAQTYVVLVAEVPLIMTKLVPEVPV
jgi:hypothetical protein